MKKKLVGGTNFGWMARSCCLLFTLVVLAGCTGVESREELEQMASTRQATQRQLAWMYANGIGGPKDLPRAFYWYKKTALQGDREGQFFVGRAFMNGTAPLEADNLSISNRTVASGAADSQSQTNRQQAILWLQKSAEQGFPKAQYALGLIYCREGGEDNYKNAVQWLIKASANGNGDALDLLGWCYYNGFGVERNIENALSCYRKAATRANGESADVLGEFYQNGIAVEKSPQKAATWFQVAAARGFGKGLYDLGLCYLHGDGVPKDHAKAVHYLKLALSLGYQKALIVLNTLK